MGNAAQETFDNRAGGKDQGGTTLVLDLAQVFERVSLPVVWAWAEHQERVQFEGYVAETITSVFPGSKWSCLLRTHCVARCHERGCEGVLALEVESVRG